jgi:hypothetical protein
MPTIRTVRLVNPRKKRNRTHSSSSRRTRRRRNTLGGGELFVMTNPRRKRRNTRSQARNSRRRRNRNPFMATRSRRHRNFGGGRRRRRNPGIAGFGANELFKLGIGAAGGAIGTRYLTQAVLGDNNTGATGYAANLAAAIALAWAAAKFAGPDIAKGVAAGGISALIMRLWSEKVAGTSPAALSGYLGDLEFSSDGLGAYITSGFPLPTVSAQNGNYLSVPSSYSWGPAGSPTGATLAPGASAAPSVSVQPGSPAGLSRFASRF